MLLGAASPVGTRCHAWVGALSVRVFCFWGHSPGVMVAVPLERGTALVMDDLAALDELNRLLDADDAETVNTSMRLPVSLRDAAALAVEHFNAAPSATTMATAALRQSLETLAMETALHLHYHEHPEARPSLAEIAHALAAQDGSPLASRPDLLTAGASAVVERHPDADADDVLLWAEAQLAVSS